MAVNYRVALGEDDGGHFIKVSPDPRHIQKINAANVTVAETSVVHHNNTLDKRVQNTKLPHGSLAY